MGRLSLVYQIPQHFWYWSKNFLHSTCFCHQSSCILPLQSNYTSQMSEDGSMSLNKFHLLFIIHNSSFKNFHSIKDRTLILLLINIEFKGLRSQSQKKWTKSCQVIRRLFASRRALRKLLCFFWWCCRLVFLFLWFSYQNPGLYKYSHKRTTTQKAKTIPKYHQKFGRIKRRPWGIQQVFEKIWKTTLRAKAWLLFFL